MLDKISNCFTTLRGVLLNLFGTFDGLKMILENILGDVCVRILMIHLKNS